MIYQGDSLPILRNIRSKSVHSCVCSPPYLGLRDYGVAGQIGLESSIDEYVQKLVEVFREVRRVLRDDGTLWLNLGDTYGTGTKAVRKPGNRGVGKTTQSAQDIARVGGAAKQLLGMPWRVALALQADGWILRSDIIWAKPNPMPESVQDRPTKSHEYVFLFAKSPRYYYDKEAIMEPLAPSSILRLSEKNYENQTGSHRAHAGAKNNGPMKAVSSGNKQRKYGDERGRPGSHIGGSIPWEGVKRNKRTVWTIPTKPYKGAHFAVFPTDLITPCILAGTPVGGIVLDPFFGSGTTGVVAKQLERDFIGIELNADYVELARKRLAGISTGGGQGGSDSRSDRTTQGHGGDSSTAALEPDQGTKLAGVRRPPASRVRGADRGLTSL